MRPQCVTWKIESQQNQPIIEICGQTYIYMIWNVGIIELGFFLRPYQHNDHVELLWNVKKSYNEVNSHSGHNQKKGSID